jgi:hypothetical protein
MKLYRKIGKAYAFFYCKASKKQIEAEIPPIRECVRTPSKLELSLTEGVYKFMGTRILGRKALVGEPIDTQLRDIAKEAKESGMRYVLEAKYEGATNEQTADELSSILNQVYQSPLYQEGEEFRGGIVYQDMGKYIFRE